MLLHDLLVHLLVVLRYHDSNILKVQAIIKYDFVTIGFHFVHLIHNGSSYLRLQIALGITHA